MKMQSIFHFEGKSLNLSSDDWLATIASKAFEAVIFDCDGTLIDSLDVHTPCLQAGTLEQGHIMTEQWYAARTGLDRKSIFSAFGASIGAPFDVNRACAVSIAHYEHVVHRARPIPESVKLAKALRARSVPLALATNGEAPVCALLLRAVGIQDLFDTVICVSEDVPPKPSPIMFQLAAEQLGHANDKVLVVEDSPQGVRAAKAARMSVIELTERQLEE